MAETEWLTDDEFCAEARVSRPTSQRYRAWARGPRSTAFRGAFGTVEVTLKVGLPLGDTPRKPQQKKAVAVGAASL